MTTVKLVSYTKPTEEFEQHGLLDAQDLIAFCARVSNPSAVSYTHLTLPTKA